MPISKSILADSETSFAYRFWGSSNRIVYWVCSNLEKCFIPNNIFNCLRDQANKPSNTTRGIDQGIIVSKFSFI